MLILVPKNNLINDGNLIIQPKTKQEIDMLKINNRQPSLRWRSISKPIISLTSMLLSFTLSTSAMAGNNNGFIDNANLPTDVKMTCPADISSWFPGGVSANGWVDPANSLDPVFADFKNNSRCDFYKWGAQMFLWLTSGASTKHVFNRSPGFYNVSLEANSQRNFLPGDGTMLLTVRKGKTDQEIELGQAGGGDVLLSQEDSLVYYGLHANDIFALYTTGQKKKAFNNALGWVSPAEDVACLKQYQSCASEVKGFCKEQLNMCTHNNFPSTLGQMRIVQKFATDYGYQLEATQLDKKPYTSPMAIELKTSWVDASSWSASKKGNYVVTEAVVPVFNRTPAKGPWTVKENKTKTLAMVGMHVVGTVNGHPEMIWSTFEHVNNAPDNSYQYTSTKQPTPKTQPYNSAGSWTFLPSGAAKPTAITANAKSINDAKGTKTSCIISVPPVTPQNPQTTCTPVASTNPDIAPIDVMRVDPWGNQHGENSDANIANNTDLASINVSVLSQLKAGDIRGNYIQTGGIWTAKGEIPPNGTDSSLRGSLSLANSTLETFYQFKHKDSFNPGNCFGCHGSSETAATSVSHIFGALQPLPKN